MRDFYITGLKIAFRLLLMNTEKIPVMKDDKVNKNV
jgi:hypothetical protein